MGTLFRYELKKILSRKILWFALALCAAVQLLNCYGDVRLALGGAVGGMKEVYARYEGQAFTDSLKAQMLSDYKEYAAAHPEEFKPSEYDESGYWARDEQIWQRRHGYGVMLAYQNLSFTLTTEDIEIEWNKARDALASGVDANGNALRPGTRRWYMRLTAQPPYVPVARYDLGWSYGSDTNLVEDLMMRTGVSMVGFAPLGVLLLLLLLLVGLPGFPGERAARIEPLLLTAARRKPAAFMKLQAVMAVVASAVLALNLLQLFLRAATYGLGGWAAPTGVYDTRACYLIAWAEATLALALGCAAGAAIITGLSALTRGSMAALGLGAASLAAQYAILSLAQSANLGGMEAGWATMLNTVISALPFHVINNMGGPFGFSPSTMGTVALFALPLALCAVCMLAAPAHFLRRRKA